MNIYKIIAFWSLFFIFSCTKGLQEQIVPFNFNVNNIATVTVMDAKIEKDSTVRVQISYSEDIDAPISTPARYEEKAVIKLKKSNGVEETLTYSGKLGIYTGSVIKGQVGETYTISIAINGQTYTASSTMFAPTTISMTITPYSTAKSGINYNSYSEEWVVSDPSVTRNRYLMEWWTNGVHNIQKDWSIDDDRLVNVNESLRFFNPTIEPQANEITVLKVAEIDKITYDYYNMYEKIARGLVGVTSQTPYNPVSSFGIGTIGNFRAVAFSSIAVLTPPNLTPESQTGAAKLYFPINKLFTKYNLYWSNTPGITKTSNIIKNIPVSFQTFGKDIVAYCTHTGLTAGSKYYYRIQSEDAQGNVSVLSPEVSVTIK